MKWHKSMMIVLITLVVVAKVGIGWAVDQNQSGQPGSGVPRMMCQDRFDAMDTNHDGVVTRDEFMAVRHPGGRGQEVFQIQRYERRWSADERRVLRRKRNG